MAVVFAVVGGAVVGVIAHTDYSDHHSYSDYDNYSDYSDAAERRRRRVEAKNKEIENLKYDINTYKEEKVNEYLQTAQLKRESGVTVSVDAVKRDGDAKVQGMEDSDRARESKTVSAEIEEIDKAIHRIDQILQEES